MERNETKTNDYSNHYGSIIDVFRRRKASADPVKAAAESLVSAIRQSEVYQTYLSAKEEIMQMIKFHQKWKILVIHINVEKRAVAQGIYLLNHKDDQHN